MTRLELIQHVALRMDEVTPDAPEFTVADLTVDGADGNPLYSLINGLVESGTLELFSVAPYWRLPQKEFENVKLGTLPSSFGSRRYIRLKVTDDFLRVAEINHSEFQRPITEVVPEASEMGKRQHNRFLMGKEARPVGVISHGEWTSGSGQSETTEQCREIDCYSIAPAPSAGSPDPALENVAATYIAKPAVISDEAPAVTVEDAVPPVLIPALEWLIAARTFGARGDANHAAICQQNAQNLLV